MKVGAVTGANRQAISGLELSFSRRGRDDRLVSLKGRLGQGALAADRNGDGAVRLTAGDAGALAKFADLYTRMDGGSLDLVLQTGGDMSSGAARVTNFTLRNEPAFRQLAAASPPPAPGRAVDTQLAHFQKMTIDFVRSPGELDIKDAVIYNSTMGLTAEGNVDFARRTIDISGTFIPAYSVNNLLGNIPLVGVVLGGAQNEGVFGITYRAQGPLGEPKLTINPLSAIAPGILRKVLGVVDGAVGRYPSPDDEVVIPTARPAVR